MERDTGLKERIRDVNMSESMIEIERLVMVSLSGLLETSTRGTTQMMSEMDTAR